MLAPIALFVYNRPQHLRRAVGSLQQNYLAGESDLIIYSDAPQSEVHTAAVHEVRDYIRQIKGFKSVTIVERDHNFGLSRSIIEGVTDTVNKYGRIIVLEDDMITSPHFLAYMNDALEYYRDEDSVICIHGYFYPIDGLPQTFFLKGADCWGWGTWRRGWDLFEADGRKLLQQLGQKDLLSRFDIFGTYSYSKMLRDQIEGKNSSWAVRWYASALLADKLTLYPAQSLVSNIGSDGSGTHCGIDGDMDVSLSDRPIKIGDTEIAENMFALRQLHLFLKKIGHTSMFGRIRKRIGQKLVRYRIINRKERS